MKTNPERLIEIKGRLVSVRDAHRASNAAADAAERGIIAAGRVPTRIARSIPVLRGLMTFDPDDPPDVDLGYRK